MKVTVSVNQGNITHGSTVGHTARVLKRLTESHLNSPLSVLQPMSITQMHPQPHQPRKPNHIHFEEKTHSEVES